MIGRWKIAKTKPFRGAEGWRAYAVGDVHGRLDLLDGALERIAVDHRERGGTQQPLLIFLGDLIDRGPRSAQVIERVRGEALPGFRTIALAGNHEEVLLRLVDTGEPGLLRQWLRFGGDAFLQSYGIDAERIAALPEEEGLEQLRTAIPPEHLSFLREMGDTFSFGDYLFVHAGIRPGIALADQSPTDLRWIRRAFLDDPRDHGAMVVHGHTITKQVDERSNRIGIDTGAYQSGVLSVIGIEGEQRWFMQQVEAGAGAMEHSS